MHALVYRRYGAPEVIEPTTLPEPVARPREVVVRVHATAVNSGDQRLRAADFPPGMGLLGRLAAGLFRPRNPVLGADLAGVVESVGGEVTELAPGDRVVGMTGMRMGAHAELCAVSMDHCLVRVADAVPLDHAVSAMFGGQTALTFLEAKAQIQPGERVLVIGASGAVGSACVQVGRLLGARVTAVCSARNAALVRDLGAERVVDYTTTERDQWGEPWDVVLDTVGALSVRACRRLATPRGRIGLIAAGLPQMGLVPWVALTSGQRLLVGPSAESPTYAQRLLDWLQDGEWTPVIDARLPWAEGSAAHARVASGRKRGTVLLSFVDADGAKESVTARSA